MRLTFKLSYGGAIMVCAALSGCSSSSGTVSADGHADHTHGVPETPSSTTATCVQLTASVPDDLTDRVERTGPAPHPVSVGTVWSNPSGSRVVRVESSSTDEPMGDYTVQTPSPRAVQSVAGTDLVVNGVHEVVWSPPIATAPCRFWTVVSQGLTETELETVLESVSETR